MVGAVGEVGPLGRQIIIRSGVGVVAAWSF